jgi:hypothetical protein
MSKKAELVGNYFGAIYLTVISFLQGFCLSQLVPNIIAYFQLSENPWTQIQLLPLILMLLVIFIVWHHYAIGIFFLRWFPNIIDTIIPFVITIGQFILISFLTIRTSIEEMDVDMWTKGFAIFLLAGSPAYFAAAARQDADLFTNIMSYPNAVIHCRISSRYYRWAGVSVLVMALFACIIVFTGNHNLLIISLILFLFHLVLAEYFKLKLIKPHFVKAMEEMDQAEKNNTGS